MSTSTTATTNFSFHRDVIDKQQQFIILNGVPDMAMTKTILTYVSEKEETIFQNSLTAYQQSLLRVAQWNVLHTDNPTEQSALHQCIQEINQFSKTTSFDTYRRLYYYVKLGVDVSDEVVMTELANEYYRGLCWVIGYYCEGVPSWSWMFPHHYSPFASDVAKYLT